MAQLLFSGAIDFTVSELKENGSVEFIMQDHAIDQIPVFAEIQLNIDDLLILREWLDKQIYNSNGSSKKG